MPFGMKNVPHCYAYVPELKAVWSIVTTAPVGDGDTAYNIPRSPSRDCILEELWTVSGPWVARCADWFS